MIGDTTAVYTLQPGFVGEGKRMAIISYAQNREDVLLHRVLSDSSRGLYIDVGACHPVTHSVTKHFYERGWDGINIEPIPAMCEALAQDRPRDLNLCVGLSDREGILNFHECINLAELSTFSDEQAEGLRRSGLAIVDHEIPVTTLASVCERHVHRTIEFLKVDVESFEREVLAGADWSRYRPRIVLVEATRPSTNIPCHEEWEPILLAADYLFAFFDGLNRYYVRAEDRELIPRLAVPANVFDDFEMHEYRSQIDGCREQIDGFRGQIDGLRSELERTRQSLVEVEAARFRAQAGLEETRAALAAQRKEWEESQAELHAAWSRLDHTAAELAPFRELGPIAIEVARGLRRLSTRAPRLAAMSKWMIRHVQPRLRVSLPEG